MQKSARKLNSKSLVGSILNTSWIRCKTWLDKRVSFAAETDNKKFWSYS